MSETVTPLELPQSEKAKAMKVLKRTGVTVLVTSVVTAIAIKLANRDSEETVNETVSA